MLLNTLTNVIKETAKTFEQNQFKHEKQHTHTQKQEHTHAKNLKRHTRTPGVFCSQHICQVNFH